MRIAILSDTHDMLRAEVKAFLQGADHILHAGDICSPPILEELRLIAPLTAVRGNNDKGQWAESLKESETIAFGGITLHMLHDIGTLAIDPQEAGIRIVVFGHSHKPRQTEKDGVLYLNPGSAGPRRFRLPIAAAELFIQDGVATARIHTFG